MKVDISTDFLEYFKKFTDEWTRPIGRTFHVLRELLIRVPDNI